MANQDPPKMSQPRNRSLNDPAMTIAPQFASILVRRRAPIAPCRNNRFNAALRQPCSQRIAVIRSIQHDPLRLLAGVSRMMTAPDAYGCQGAFQERHFRRGCRVQVKSQRSTRAIDQNHALCAFAAFGLADLCAPFFAGMKVPSPKHSSQRSFSRSFRSARKLRHRFSSVPSSSQSRNRRQQVLGLPYSLGRACHGEPVQRIHKMPSKQRRSSIRGRPPFGLRLPFGSWMRMRFHCLSVKCPRYAML